MRDTAQGSLAQENPAAQALLAEVALMLFSRSTRAGLGRPGLGLATAAHRLPFQCTISVTLPPRMLSRTPAAQALLAEVALTEFRLSLVALGFGLATCDHARPFQWRTRVRSKPAAVPKFPTAQALLAEVALTPNSEFGRAPGLGLATFDHARPFQRRVSVPPTAQALLAEVALTPYSVPGRPVPGTSHSRADGTCAAELMPDAA